MPLKVMSCHVVVDLGVERGQFDRPARASQSGGRTSRYYHSLVTGRYRRMFLLAAHPGEGRFAEPRAGGQPWRQQLVFMPHCGRSWERAGRVVSGAPGLSDWRRSIAPKRSLTASRHRVSFSARRPRAPWRGRRRFCQRVLIRFPVRQSLSPAWRPRPKIPGHLVRDDRSSAVCQTRPGDADREQERSAINLKSCAR